MRQEAASPLTITSFLSAVHRPALERLLFFNAQQPALRERIAEAVERYGTPEIVTQQGRLRVGLAGGTDAQSLFAVDPGGVPVGCAVFLRAAPERFVVLHLGVEPEWSGRGRLAHAHVLLTLVGAIRAAARRTRGVQRIEILYGAGALAAVKV